MVADSKGNEAGDADVTRLRALVRRVVGARVRDPETVDDLVQETLTRVLTARGRLGEEALAPYAVVTARNLIRSLGRQEERRWRHSHRLVEDRTVAPPDDEVMQEEERAALAVAWSKLGPDERAALAAHELEGADVVGLARESKVTPGAVAVRLARTRARLRVEYVLALRRVELPTERCRAVLLAISSRDKRRQEALGTGEHLLHCECCASLSEPLLRRSRPLAALWPFVAAWQLVKWLGRGVSRAGRWARGHPIHATGGATGFAVVVASIVVLNRPDPTWLRSGDRSLLPPPPATELVAAADKSVEARSVTVQSVVTPTGFWVGEGSRERVFVELLAMPAFPITAGHKVSFVGYVDPNHEDSVERYGVEGQDGVQLREEGYHLHAEANAIRKG